MEAGAPPPAAPPPAPAGAAYPIRYDVEYKEELSRLTTFFRMILVIPQALVVYALLLVAEILAVISWFAIVFTGKMPRGMFDFMVNAHRWAANVNTYALLMRDEYPPFSWDPGQYPVVFEADYTEHRDRLTVGLRLIWAIPAVIVVYLIEILVGILVLIAWFAIVITGKFPRGMFDLVKGGNRWYIRVIGYLWLLTDEYPPFSFE